MDKTALLLDEIKGLLRGERADKGKFLELINDLLEVADLSGVGRRDFRKFLRLPDYPITASRADWVDPRIAYDIFPVNDDCWDSPEPEIEEVKAQNGISSAGMLDLIRNKGGRPGNFGELLMHGIRNSVLPAVPVVALGTVAVIDNREYVAYFDVGKNKRYLPIIEFETIWRTGTKFIYYNV